MRSTPPTRANAERYCDELEEHFENGTLNGEAAKITFDKLSFIVGEESARELWNILLEGEVESDDDERGSPGADAKGGNAAQNLQLSVKDAKKQIAAERYIEACSPKTGIAGVGGPKRKARGRPHKYI